MPQWRLPGQAQTEPLQVSVIGFCVLHVLGEIAQLLFLSDWKTACDGFNYVDGRLLVMFCVLVEGFCDFARACLCAMCSLTILFAAMSCSNVDNSP